MNPRPADYKSAALPTELHQLAEAPAKMMITKRSMFVKLLLKTKKCFTWGILTIIISLQYAPYPPERDDSRRYL